MKRKYSALAIIVILSSFLLFSCSSTYNWGWYTVSPFTQAGQGNLRFLLLGLVPTINLSVLSYIISVILALVIAIVGRMKYLALRTFSKTWVTFFRTVPVLVMLLWMYYGFPILTGVQISIFWAALITMSLCESAFLAEIFRAGIEAISKSQVESAYVMGANTIQVYVYIILPQVFTKMLPALVNQLVYMLKISSLASVIGYNELTRKANELIVTEYRPLEIYSILILEYLALILLASLLEKWVSKKLGPSYED